MPRAATEAARRRRSIISSGARNRLRYTPCTASDGICEPPRAKGLRHDRVEAEQQAHPEDHDAEEQDRAHADGADAAAPRRPTMSVSTTLMPIQPSSASTTGSASRSIGAASARSARAEVVVMQVERAGGRSVARQPVAELGERRGRGVLGGEDRLASGQAMPMSGSFQATAISSVGS